MLYREITAIRSEIHTKHINTLYGQNLKFLNVNLKVHIVTTGIYTVNKPRKAVQVPFCAPLRNASLPV